MQMRRILCDVVSDQLAVIQSCVQLGMLHRRVALV
jgi:hypothetical protein